MRPQELLILASAASVMAATDATVVKDNKPGAYAIAHMSGDSTGGLFAEIFAGTSSDGEGAEVTVNVNGGPVRTGGPFSFHVHEKAVDSTGDCQSTGGHLDPTARQDLPACDKSKPETCQVGDLSGKASPCQKLPGCSLSFRDKFLSLTPGNPGYIGDKSFVIHNANKTRIGCANFSTGVKLANGTLSGSATGNSTSSSGSGGSTTGGSTSGSGSSSDPSGSSGSSGSGTGGSSSGGNAPSQGAASQMQATGYGALFVALVGMAFW